MSPPRLLDKKTVNTELANQKAQQIKEGLALAKKVDAVRETLKTEEENVEIFRQQTIKRVQAEIDTKISERDTLVSGNKRLREERVLAQAPIDLKEEWQQVREDRARNTSWQNSLEESQIKQLAMEAHNVDRTQFLDRRESTIKDNEYLVERTLLAAETEFNQASEFMEKAKKDSKRMMEHGKEVEQSALIKEEEVNNREKYLLDLQTKLQAQEVDLSNREKKLKSRQELFLRAEHYLQNKKP